MEGGGNGEEPLPVHCFQDHSSVAPEYEAGQSLFHTVTLFLFSFFLWNAHKHAVVGTFEADQ